MFTGDFRSKIQNLMQFPDKLDQACQDIFTEVAASPHANELAAYVAGVWRQNDDVLYKLQQAELKHHMREMFAESFSSMGNLVHPLICALTHAVLTQATAKRDIHHDIKVVPQHHYTDDWVGNEVLDDGLLCMSMLPFYFCDARVVAILQDPISNISVDLNWRRSHYITLGKDPSNMIVVVPDPIMICEPDYEDIEIIRDRVREVFGRSSWAEPYLEYFDENIVDTWKNITTVDSLGRILKGIHLPCNRASEIYVDLME